MVIRAYTGVKLTGMKGIKGMEGMGFQVIRIPITYGEDIGPAQSALNDPLYPFHPFLPVNFVPS